MPENRSQSKEGASETAAACRIEITPTPAQFRQLCRDLKRLKGGEIPSNTDLILEAVHLMAKGRIGSAR